MIFHLILQSDSITTLWNALIVILIIAAFSRRLRIPYEVSLIIAGILTAIFAPHALPTVSPETFLNFLLPPIVFHTALHLDFKALFEEGKFVFTYAFLGTLASFLLVGVISYFALGLSIVNALLLGIILSPTDPISVISALKDLKAPKRLSRIIEGEALFNDGVSIVVFGVLLGFSSGTSDLGGISLVIAERIVVGVFAGLGVGYVAALIASRLHDDSFVQTAFSFFTMYAVFQITTIIGGSGIIGTALAGVVIGNQLPPKVAAQTYSSIDNVWEFIDFIITSFSFVLIGNLVDLVDLYAAILVVITVFVIVLGSRFVAIFGMASVLNLVGGKVERKWQWVITWAGLRGVVSIMLASSLPSGASGLVEVVFGVVLLSLFIQGLSIETITRRLIKPARV